MSDRVAKLFNAPLLQMGVYSAVSKIMTYIWQLQRTELNSQ